MVTQLAPTDDVDVTQDDPRSREPDAGNGDKPAEGISEFLGKVLDQLSVSAWLPATMLVGNAAVLIQLIKQGNLNVADAINTLIASPLGILIVLLLAIILTTVITQAFAFEVIRLLEGYWIDTWPVRSLTSIRSRRYLRKSLRIRRRRDKAQRAAFAEARDTMLERNIPRVAIDINEDAVLGRASSRHSPDDLEQAAGTDWRMFGSPALLRRCDALEMRMSRFPEDYRILPTRLGNTLRAAEDELKNNEGDLEGFVLRNYERLPNNIKAQHEEYRSRLDMYCILVFIFIVLAMFAATAFALVIGAVPAVVVGISYLLFALVSYEAAISSARGYCEVLRVIDSRLAPPNDGGVGPQPT